LGWPPIEMFHTNAWDVPRTFWELEVGSWKLDLVAGVTATGSRTIGVCLFPASPLPSTSRTSATSPDHRNVRS
jgi:hypothetical protein